METGTLDVEGRGLTCLPANLFVDTRMLSAVTRAKFNGNKFQVLFAKRGIGPFGLCDLVECTACKKEEPYCLVNV